MESLSQGSRCPGREFDFALYNQPILDPYREVLHLPVVETWGNMLVVVKACGVSGGVSPLILNPVTLWR